ncbi:MAG: FAD-dependent oxidoreductase [Rhodospirillaceae bacterium]|nr:FAD-dependent oxidoreductase [Rhodospirillaceae bacterium]|tara:strand:- start:20163 stop:21314 length:1152 start_codon:yes stop_codon:yes gene_type:complete
MEETLLGTSRGKATLTEKVDCIVIGAGVVGLAIARALAMAGREVIILEAETTYGTHTSTRNSGCIHAGINYTPGSLKSQLALRGRDLLYQYCPDHGVSHEMTGKFVVAVDDADIPELHALKEKANKNGLQEIYIADHAEIREKEPNLAFAGALYSPLSGLIEAHELMTAYLGDAEQHGAVLAVNAPVKSGRVIEDGIELVVGGDHETTIRCALCVNSAGHSAQRVAAVIIGVPDSTIPEQYLTRGCYFVIHGRRPFNRMVYPLPKDHKVSVHVCPDLSGLNRFGPDVEIVDSVDYTLNPDRAEFFYKAVRRFLPDLKDGELQPGYTGVRPKLSLEQATANDFVIHGKKDHGVDGLINLFGIESPGLTSSMAIGEYVKALAGMN